MAVSLVFDMSIELSDNNTENQTEVQVGTIETIICMDQSLLMLMIAPCNLSSKKTIIDISLD